MKRIALLFPLLLCFFILPCRAASPEEAVADYYDALPREVADALPDGLSEKLKEGDPTATSVLDAPFLFDFLGTSFTDTLKASVAPLVTLTATVFLAALLRAFSDTAGETAGKAIRFAAGLSILLSLFRSVQPAWQLAVDTVKGIGLLSKSFLPLATAVGAVSGTVSSSAVSASWLTLLLTLVEQLTESILMPLFGIGFGFLIVSLFLRLSENADLSGVVGSIKNIFTFLLTLVGTALSAVMAYQSTLAKSADTVLLRSIKFASGNMIPVLGSTLSETAGHYLASLSLIRSSAGTLVAVSLLLFVLPPIISLLILRAGFTLAATVAGILGCPQEGETIRDASALLDLALATVTVLSVVFLLLTGAFTSAVTA
ncbi:MAG: hypothetical protein E7630_02925 [Ruminococcaceae bacterium]|nr:hypothetical protein [Oscillospiraceae bacterium]